MSSPHTPDASATNNDTLVTINQLLDEHMTYAEAAAANSGVAPHKVSKADVDWRSPSDSSDGDDSAGSGDEAEPAPLPEPQQAPPAKRAKVTPLASAAGQTATEAGVQKQVSDDEAIAEAIAGVDSADEEAAMLEANDEQPKKKRKTKGDGDERADRAGEGEVYDCEQRKTIEALTVTNSPTDPHSLKLDGHFRNNYKAPLRSVQMGLFVVKQIGETKEGQPIFKVVDGYTCVGSAKQNPATMFVLSKHLHVPLPYDQMDPGQLADGCPKDCIDHPDGTVLYAKGSGIPRIGGTPLFKGRGKNATMLLRHDGGGTIIGSKACIPNTDDDALVWVTQGIKPDDRTTEEISEHVTNMVRDAYNMHGIGIQCIFFGGGRNGQQVKAVFEPARNFIKEVVRCTTVMGELNQCRQREDTMPTVEQAMAEMSVVFPVVWQIAAVLTPNGRPVAPEALKILALMDGVPGLARVGSLAELVEFAADDTEAFAKAVREALQTICTKIESSPALALDKFFYAVKEKCKALIAGTTMTIAPVVEVLLDKLFNLVNSMGVYVRWKRCIAKIAMLEDEQRQMLEDAEKDAKIMNEMQAIAAPPVVNPKVKVDPKLAEWLDDAPPQLITLITQFVIDNAPTENGKRDGLIEATTQLGDGSDWSVFEEFVQSLAAGFEEWMKHMCNHKLELSERELVIFRLRENQDGAIGGRRSRLVATIMQPLIEAQAVIEREAIEQQLRAAKRQAQNAYTNRRSGRKSRPPKRLIEDGTDDTDNEHAKRARTDTQAAH